MEAFFQSFLLIFVNEMGDKTQLVALVLAAHFRKPFAILFGIALSTLLNHGLASSFGATLTHYFSQQNLKWVIASIFIGVGLWMLRPEKEEKIERNYRWGAFVTTTLTFFIAEMGDKTQIAAAALGAKFGTPLFITLGAVFGMVSANGLAVFFGHQLKDKISMPFVHRIASLLFILFGVAILLGF